MAAPRIPVAQAIPVAYPVADLEARARAEAQARRDGRSFRHDLKSGDSVPGLAMRYGVTTDAIRKENKLWSHDSLAARSFVVIPGRVDETGVDRHLPYRGAAPKGGLDKSSVDSLFSSCDAQTQQTRSALTQFSPGVALETGEAPPADYVAPAAATVPRPPAAAQHPAGDPPTYEAAVLAETNIDAVGYSPVTRRETNAGMQPLRKPLSCDLRC